MPFRNKGRPLEDRLARQREIYRAVSPLILEVGARRLSMREAANAACLSVGGLYYYFPTKRDLVLHGLCPEAIFRCCQDFEVKFGHLAHVDPQRYIAEGILDVVNLVGFCRPAIHAALEIGTQSFWEVVDGLLTSTALQFEAGLQQVVPEASDQEVHQLGRALRRSICAALLDKSISSDEFRDELHTLVDGYLVRRERREEAPLGTLAGTGIPSG